MSASDSHRAEVENQVARILGTAILKNDKNYTNDIMALLDSERERWIGEVKLRLPKHWPITDDLVHTNLQINLAHNEALDAVSKVLDELY